MTKFMIVQVEELVSHYDELAKGKKTPPGAVYFIECQDFIKISWCRLWNLYRCVHLDLQRGNP